MYKIIFVLLFLFSQISIYSQENSIYMAGVELKIGMQKKDIISKIDTNYYKIMEQDNGTLLTLCRADKNIENMIGLLTFDKNYRLIFISRDWGNFYSEASIEFANTLSGLLKELNKSGNKRAEITTETFSIPGHNSTEIRMIFKTKEVRINIWSGSNTNDGVSIREVLSK